MDATGKHVGKIVIDLTERPSTIYPGVELHTEIRDDATYWIVVGGVASVLKWPSG